MTQALLLVDIQQDYFPGGAMELSGMEAAAGNAGRLLAAFRKDSLPVIHIRHESIRPGAAFFIPGTPGADIHPSVRPIDNEPIIVKYFPNSFRDTPLLDSLTKAGIDQVVICGAMSHMCIDATTRAAFDLGFSCSVIDDACATRDLSHGNRIIQAADVHGAFMAAIASVYATVMTTREFCQG